MTLSVFRQWMWRAVRVVIVSDFAEVNGGAAKVAVTSARGLAEADVDVTYVCAVLPVSPLLNHTRIAVHCLGFPEVWTKRNPLAAAAQAIWHRRAQRALEQILAQLPSEDTVVHFHQWTKAFSPSVLSVPVRRRLPSVVSLHDYFLVCPNGAYYRYAESKPCGLKPMSLPCLGTQCDRANYAHKAVRILRQAATAKAVARAGSSLSVLNVSPAAETVVAPFLPKEHARFVARSPVDAERGAPIAVAENAQFVFAGRLSEEKGIRRLAEVARDAGFNLTICGDGPLLGELQAFGSPVACTGWLDALALSAVLRRARALVFPSTWYETGGLVVAEALALGVPVIVSRGTGAAAWVEDGVNGILVDPADRHGLRAAMRKLTDASTAAAMGEAAHRLYWADPPSLEAHTGKLLSIYRRVIDEHRARATLPHAVPA